jgi:transmembrane sensor
MYTNGLAVAGEVNIADVKSWKEARLVFEKQSLKAITTQLQRWYNVNIVFENKAKASEQICGAKCKCAVE